METQTDETTSCKGEYSLKIGFSIEPAAPVEDSIPVPPVRNEPVRSLVRVRFEADRRVLTYYNDRFNLAPGDRVFVSGKLAGCPGTVESVTTRFKINLADYEKVIHRASAELHGTYERMIDKMVSYDATALRPEAFRTWAAPPKANDAEFVLGEGYTLDPETMGSDDEINPAVLQRAFDYCRQGNVAYISVLNGLGTAFVNGTKWYEVNFRLDGSVLTEMYCDCPYPDLCKHLLAVSVTLQALMQAGLNTARDFVVIDDSYFWLLAAKSTSRITL